MKLIRVLLTLLLLAAPLPASAHEELVDQSPAADSVVEAGLYVTAGTKVNIVDGGEARTVKAVELSGVPNLLFRRNSATGAVEVLPRVGAGIVLNSQLHA